MNKNHRLPFKTYDRMIIPSSTCNAGKFGIAWMQNSKRRRGLSIISLFHALHDSESLLTGAMTNGNTRIFAQIFRTATFAMI